MLSKYIDTKAPVTLLFKAVICFVNCKTAIKLTPGYT